ncbi:site-specific DNA-methyltransferase [Gallibacterium anatis]|uniref:site-specific DNA-methyltransferase n=1 Tax=Gallibacterium anatis TaxID=750 RepID=UPI0039FC24F8
MSQSNNQNMETEILFDPNSEPQDARLAQLKQLFPDCFDKNGVFLAEKMAQALRTSDIDTSKEYYTMNWLGKSYAKVLRDLPPETLLAENHEHNSRPEHKNSQNLLIKGDNLEVLKHLTNAYKGAVKMIYIDPPYNTGSDGFVYQDDRKFTAEQLAQLGGMDLDEAQRVLDFTAKKSNSHSAWLTFMYPRLYIARELLKDDGVIFISIDDNEQAQLKLLCDEVFGEENFVATFPWRKRTAKSDVPFGVSQDYEWIMAYAKSELFLASIEGKERKYYETPDFPNRPWRIHDLTKQTSASERPNSFFTMIDPKTGKEYPADERRTWAVSKDTFQEYYDKGKIVFPDDYDFLKISRPAMRYFKDDDMAKAGDLFGKIAVSTKLPDTVGMSQDGTKEITNLFDGKIFTFPKPSSLIRFLLSITTNKNDLILDFFAGSGTTAHAVMQLNAEDKGNRQFIMVKLPTRKVKPIKQAIKPFLTSPKPVLKKRRLKSKPIIPIIKAI